MKQSEIIDLMNYIESNVPVYSFKVRKTFIWPLVRLRLGYYIIETQKNDLIRAKDISAKFQEDNFAGGKNARTILRRVTKYIYRKIKPVKEVQPHRPHSLKEQNSPILLFSYLVNSSFIGNERVNIYIDPLSKILDALKHDYSYEPLVFFGGEAIMPGDDFSKFYDDYFILKKNVDLTQEEQELICELEAKVSSLLPFSLPYGIVLDWVKMHFSYLDIFKSYLTKKYPNLKLLFFYDWPNSIGLAVHHACADLHIISVELQHGQSLDEDFCTSRWLNLPKDGVNFFPSIFWEWDEVTCKRFNEWIPHRSQAIIGGKLDVGSFQFNDAKIERKYILISLQNEALPDFFVDFVKNNLHLRWMFRIHPRHTYMKNWLNENFKGLSIITDEGNQPIHYSFAQAYLHCTLSSGSAIDALYFGLNSIILNEDGYLSFKQDIENGKMFFCQDYESVENLFSERLETWQKGNTNAMELVIANHNLNIKAVEYILKAHL
jgi:hypothetical protein